MSPKCQQRKSAAVAKVPRADIGCRLMPPQDALKKLAQDACLGFFADP
jgi:hypothetical protein